MRNGYRFALRICRVGPEGDLRGAREWRLGLPVPGGLPAGWFRKALLAAAVLFMVLAPWYFEKIALADWDERAPAAVPESAGFSYPDSGR